MSGGSDPAVRNGRCPVGVAVVAVRPGLPELDPRAGDRLAGGGRAKRALEDIATADLWANRCIGFVEVADLVVGGGSAFSGCCCRIYRDGKNGCCEDEK